jgi:hypothetical protein
MRRLSMLAIGLCAVPFAADAQDDKRDDKLKARCDQLFPLADRAVSRRGEGGGGPNLAVQGAGVDCSKGRYEQGIRELEKVLRSQGYTVPPPP